MGALMWIGAGFINAGTATNQPTPSSSSPCLATTSSTPIRVSQTNLPQTMRLYIPAGVGAASDTPTTEKSAARTKKRRMMTRMVLDDGARDGREQLAGLLLEWRLMVRHSTI